MSKQGRIDYLRIVRYNPSQETIAEVTANLDACASIAQREHKIWGGSRVTLQKVKKTGATRIIWNVWGHLADTLAMFMPAAWWTLVGRVDWREELPQISKADWGRYCRQADEVGAFGVNTQKFKKQPAEKNDKRGVGGEGVQFGSWKSDECETHYMRGSELPAVEFRLNNRGARKLGEAVAIQMRDNPTRNAYALACCDLSAWADNWREKHLGTDDMAEYVRTLVAERKNEELVIKKARELLGAFGEAAARGTVTKRRLGRLADVTAGDAQIVPLEDTDPDGLPW